ncbi:hypothetical protein ACFPZL_08365 [Leucobacter soli]|uniref:Uncharacterized protein n=1 Tax=Leucobacter soli TaxID=2812850 RepID=A0A916K2F7_9MICO|nr:hypothetical protein [Leucobacter soli]CAG7620350.1 hypothetical protein LEUCIP111803_02360 [Leucobacter soli]
MTRKHVERQSEARSHIVDEPHPATRYEAGNGQGTTRAWAHEGKTQDHPILDGSTQSAEAERDVDNPWRGIDDPSLHRHPEHIPESARHHLHDTA